MLLPYADMLRSKQDLQAICFRKLENEWPRSENVFRSKAPSLVYNPLSAIGAAGAKVFVLLSFFKRLRDSLRNLLGAVNMMTESHTSV